MSLFRTLDRTSAVSNTAHARSILTFLYPDLQTKSTSKRSFSRSAVTRPSRLTRHGHHTDDFFIQALVQAGSCRGHKKHMSMLRESTPYSANHHSTRRKSTWLKPEEHEAAEQRGTGPVKKLKRFAKKELEALVDYYNIEFDTRPEEESQDTGPLVWNVGDDHEPWPLREEGDAVHIARLKEFLLDDESPHDQIFETYKKLPPPGVVYLDTTTIRALLHHLSIVERPSPPAMQRFLSVLDDMKNAHIHITRSEWTSAIHLTGKAMGRVSADDLQSALYLWRDMEHRAGIKGSVVTLNILFDVAVKAGKYTLAETFLKEIQQRKLPLHRFFRTSLLYYYGVLQDGNAVRKTYQDLVNAGDIVDTAVMNAVIAALMRAGEPSAAEHVFERMKRLHASKRVPAPGHKFFNRTWRDRRLVALHLTYDGRRLKNTQDHEGLQQLQEYAPIAPDARTYGLLIRHQAATAGNIDRVHELLQEMRYNSVPLEGTIFIAIFHGFNAFGGVRYSSWTRDKLEKIWTQYLKALREGLERTWISVMAVIAALKAFRKCTDADRTLRAWEEIRKLWKPNEEELENVMRMLRKLNPDQSQGFFDNSTAPGL
jgi:pentatricopeptide repeat protein